MKTSKFILAIAVAIGSSAAFAGTFESLKFGDTVAPGTTIGGRAITMAAGETWVKDSRRTRNKDGSEIKHTSANENPAGIAIMNLVSDGKVIARRVVNTKNAAHCWQTPDQDMVSISEVTSDVVCASVKKLPGANGATTLALQKTLAHKNGYVRETLILDDVAVNDLELRSVAAHGTFWLLSDSDKSVATILAKTN